MKQVFVLLIGCLPLIWLTGSNLVEWRRAVKVSTVTGNGGKSAKLDLEAAQARAETVAGELSDELPFVQGLTPIEPFGESLIELPFTRMKAFDAMVKAWKDYTQVHAAVVRVVQVYPGRTWPKSEDELSELNKFLMSHVLDGVSGGKMIERWCQERRTTLDMDIGKLKAIETMNSKFEKRSFDAAWKQAKLLEKYPLTDDQMLRVKHVERASQFEVFWKDFPRAPIPSLLADVRRRAEKLADRLKRSPSLLDENDLVDEKRKSYLDDRIRELSELHCRIKVDELFENPPDDFTPLAQKCHQILDEDSQAQPRLQERLTKWIEDRIAIKKPPKYDQDEREAWQLDGTHRRGVFREPNGFAGMAPGAQYYKYWKVPAKFRMGRTFDNEIYVKDLVALPGEMLEIKLCKVFNEARLEVLKKPDPKKRADDTKIRWQKFASACEEMQTQIADYYSKVDLDKKNLSFESEAQLADEIVKDWSKLEHILKPIR